jgi:two-component sensor histidine kinase
MKPGAERNAAVPERRHAADVRYTEAHHRIANSLSVITSLVRLQALDVAKRQRDMTWRDVQLILEDVAARIATVALLHRLLSETPEQETVDVGSYLRQVCSSLATALSFAGRIDVSGPPAGICLVQPDQAVPIAVLVSELVTNAIKYAHPSGVEGRICVTCRRDNDGSLALEISDDGVGLPEGFDPAIDGGLGLQIVRALSDQLRTPITFDSTSLGLSVRLRLPGGPH